MSWVEFVTRALYSPTYTIAGIRPGKKPEEVINERCTEKPIRMQDPQKVFRPIVEMVHSRASEANGRNSNEMLIFLKDIRNDDLGISKLIKISLPNLN